MEITTKGDMSTKVTKAVVDYIRNNSFVNNKNKVVYINDLVLYVNNCVGISEVNTEEEKQLVVNHIKKSINVLEEIKAIQAVSVTPSSCIKDYIQYKKYNEQPKLVDGVSSAYKASQDYQQKVNALKSNEKILSSGVAVLQLDDKEVSVAIVKDVIYDKVKFCNSIFDYTKVAQYIGCYNRENNKIDFVATAPGRNVFYCNSGKHILPETRELINLYYMVNLSDCKYLFMQQNDIQPAPSLLSLRNDGNKILATDKLAFKAPVYKSI